MRVDLYTRCYNDAHMLEFAFAHYDPIVAHYYVYDDGSTDGSLDVLRSKTNVEVRRFQQSVPDSKVLSSRDLMESCWTESRTRADWAIVTDLDEHLYHPDLIGYLERCARDGITIVPALGYQMIAEELPPAGSLLTETVTRGAPWQNMCKLSVIRPDAVEATHFAVGRHSAAPSGNAIAPHRDELLLLHYKYLGFERTQRRHEAYNRRLGAKDFEAGWGHKYAWDRARLRDDWQAFDERAIDVVAAQPHAHETYGDAPRWWEPYRRSPT